MYCRPLRFASGAMSLIALSARSSDSRLIRSLSGFRSMIWFLVSLSRARFLHFSRPVRSLMPFSGGLQDVDVLELLVGQLDLGLVLQDVADGGLEVLVGKRRGRARRPGRRRGRAARPPARRRGELEGAWS